MKTINDYADLVKEQHALNTTIAPVETDLTSASKTYAVGQKFIYDGVLYQAKTAIAQGAALVLNTNYEAADDVSSEIQTLTNEASAIVNKLGAKNVMPVTMGVIKRCNTAGTWNDNVYTHRGITYTIYTDVFGNVTKINANGTSNEASAHLFFADGYKKPSQLGLELNVEYALNGCPDGGDAYGYSVSYDSGGAWSYPSDFGEATTFTFESDSNTYRPMIKVRNSGTVINNKDFYPMLRPASIANDEYAPYAMTNRELSESDVTITPESGITIDYNCIKRVGKVVTLNFRFTIASDFTIDANAKIATINPMPASSDASMLIPTATTWNGANGGLLTITKNTGDIKLVTNDFTAGNSYVVNATYICD